MEEEKLKISADRLVEFKKRKSKKMPKEQLEQYEKMVRGFNE